MDWKHSLAKIAGNCISGYFAGLGAVSLTDSLLEIKLLEGLFGSAILAGIAIGKLLTEYGYRQKSY